MTGTSGGGFALMTEAISFASIAEIPILVVNSQRAGPASGVPTYSAQGDLLFSLNSGHGDIVRFVASPGDANEAYYLSGTLLNLAWKYQTPTILLTDKELSESTYKFYPKKLKRKRNCYGTIRENMKDMPKLKMEYLQWLIQEKQLLKQQAMSMIERAIQQKTQKQLLQCKTKD